MKAWRTEYKFLVILAVVFIIILGFFFINGGYVTKLQESQRKKELVTCTNSTFTKGIQYTTYTCTIQDEFGEKYTIEYPQIEEKSKDIQKLNRQLKKSFDQAYQSIEYTNINKKLQLASFEKVNFQVYSSRGITSFLVENKNIVGTVLSKTNQYRVYNIDTINYHILEEDEVKEKLGIDRNYSSTLKSIVVKMYLENFRYDYNNELEIYRNTFIDDSVKNVTYSAIQNLYIDDSENIHFIIYLFNPDYGETIPYDFSIDSIGNTHYEILQ